MIRSTRSLSSQWISALALAASLVLGACGAEEAPEAEVPVAATGAAEVEYEAAYPEEVSEEGLTAGDVEQQEEANHGHGDDTHAHGDEPHHDDGGHSH